MRAELDDELLKVLMAHHVVGVGAGTIRCSCDWFGRRDEYLEHNPFLDEAIRIGVKAGQESVYEQLRRDGLVLARDMMRRGTAVWALSVLRRWVDRQRRTGS